MQSPDEMSFDSIWDGLQNDMDRRLEAPFKSIYDGGASNQLSVMHLKSSESGRQKKSQPTGGRSPGSVKKPAAGKRSRSQGQGADESATAASSASTSSSAVRNGSQSEVLASLGLLDLLGEDKTQPRWAPRPPLQPGSAPPRQPPALLPRPAPFLTLTPAGFTAHKKAPALALAPAASMPIPPGPVPFGPSLPALPSLPPKDSGKAAKKPRIEGLPSLEDLLDAHLVGAKMEAETKTTECEALAMELIAARLQAREAEDRAKRIHKSLELKKSQAAEATNRVITLWAQRWIELQQGGADGASR